MPTDVSTQAIEIHPEASRLRTDNEALRAEIAILLCEGAYLIRSLRPYILAQYQVLLGRWELEVLSRECEVGRLRRKLALIQAQLNRRCVPDLPGIEETLEREFREWEARVRAAAQGVEQAERQLGSLMSEHDAHELRRLYRMLVRRLHPDLNGELDENGKLYWERVQTAYANCDVAELEALAVLTEARPPPACISTLEQLAMDNERLRREVTRLATELAKTKAGSPFDMEANLEDEGWVAAERSRAEARTAELERRRALLSERLAAVLLMGRPNDDEHRPN